MTFGRINHSNSILTLENGSYIAYSFMDPASVDNALAILKARAAEIRLFCKSGILYTGNGEKLFN